MKKCLFISLLVLISILLISFLALADNDGKENILNIYQINDNYSGGIKVPLEEAENFYWGTNLEYHPDEGSLFELNSTYRIPDVWFFDFYGGGGVELFTQDRDTDFFFLLGGEMIFFFSEVKYSINDNKVTHRSGFKFDF